VVLIVLELHVRDNEYIGMLFSTVPYFNLQVADN